MPRRTDIKRVLVIGSGPIVIGQACEFDYSGTQACKALRAEGLEVVLMNSNPATIMTDPASADAIYIEPINWQTLERIIEKERPSALLPTMGGQTALNCALDLDSRDILERYGVELIAASRAAIEMAEDREQFRVAMQEIGLEVPKGGIASTLEQALKVQGEVGFPTIIRPSFTLGGSGGGIAYNREGFNELVGRGGEPQVAWKQVVLTTGSHHLQAYWLDSGHTRALDLFPFIYRIDQQRWIPLSSVFLHPPDVKGDYPRGAWNRTCIQCHTTHGRPRIHHINHMDTSVAELAISCEACHGPAEQHVKNAESDRDELAVVHPASLSPRRSAEVCGQCHSSFDV